MGILTASALGAISKEVAVGIGLVIIVAGGILVGRTFARGLMSRERGDRLDAEPDASPDRDRM